MTPPIYEMIKADPVLPLFFGTPLRIYPDEADEGCALPYATFQTVSGNPENYLAERPDMDFYRVQFDVWAVDAASRKAAAAALRDSLEDLGHQVSINPTGREGDKRTFRASFDFEFWLDRIPSVDPSVIAATGDTSMRLDQFSNDEMPIHPGASQ